MKDKRYITCTDKRVIITCIVSIVVFALCIGIEKILINKSIFSAILTAINGMLIITSFIVSLCTLSVIVLGTIIEHSITKKNLESLMELRKLPNEFTQLTIKDVSGLDSFLTIEDIHCEAKLDENEQLVYKINIEAEYTTDDYFTFLEYFEIN